MRISRPATACLLIAIAVGATACSSSGTKATSSTAASSSTTVAAKPPYKIRQFTLTFVDRSRPTPPNGTYAGATSRTLPTVITLPVGAPTPLPLVVFSTGIDGTGTNYQGLYDHWVAAGYGVAAPVFPLSNAHAPGGSTIADFSSQPGDVRFVLDQLLKLSAAKKGTLAGEFDPTQIALAGKSLGALTTLRAAFLVSDHETRENAVISLTGGGTASSTMFTGVKVPLLLVHGDADRTVPYPSSVHAFEGAAAPKFLVTLFGQDHGGAFDGEPNAAARVVEAVTLDFLNAYVRDEPDAIARLQQDGAVPKVASIRARAPVTVLDLEAHGDVWVLSMRNGENRFNLASIAALHAALDRVEQVDGPVALVTTGEGKFYSNGLDLDWLLSAGPEAATFIDDVHRLLGRVLGFPGVTVAAVNGHAFAGGAMLVCAHDVVVMREDRGYWCLPEVDLGLPLSPAMHAVVAAHVPEPTLRDALLSGRRYAAPDALAAGIVTEVAPEDLVLERAIARAAELASKNRDVIRTHKQLMYGRALELCGA